jgi:hypothetical protein
MSRYIARRNGDLLDLRQHIQPMVSAYWRTVAKPSIVKEIPYAVNRELETLVTALDHLGAGELARLGDVLMGRFQAVETSLSDGWRIAQHLEVLPPAAVSSVPVDRRDIIVRMEARDLRTTELRQKVG